MSVTLANLLQSSNTPPSQMYPLSVVATILSTPISVLNRMVRVGQLPVIRVTRGRKLITHGDLEAAVQSMAAPRGTVQVANDEAGA